MKSSAHTFPVYLEVGRRRVFAGALDWPGWCRSGRDESAALDALLACGPRYAAATRLGGALVIPPTDLDQLDVVERLPGDATTDFGAPGAVPSSDHRALDDDRDHLAAILQGCWLTFGQTVTGAQGHELRKGPRGGGRELSAIVSHVVESNRSYFGRVAWKPVPSVAGPPEGQLLTQLPEALGVLARAAAGEHPDTGPRGGELWPSRYFVRRVAWHLLDHAWEIEDRVL